MLTTLALVVPHVYLPGAGQRWVSGGRELVVFAPTHSRSMGRGCAESREAKPRPPSIQYRVAAECCKGRIQFAAVCVKSGGCCRPPPRQPSRSCCGRAAAAAVARGQRWHRQRRGRKRLRRDCERFRPVGGGAWRAALPRQGRACPRGACRRDVACGPEERPCHRSRECFRPHGGGAWSKRACWRGSFRQSVGHRRRERPWPHGRHMPDRLTLPCGPPPPCSHTAQF
jgi:hypothetical protein